MKTKLNLLVAGMFLAATSSTLAGQRPEAIEVAGHELADALDAARLQARRDIDQDQGCGDRWPRRLGDRDEGCESAERGAHERRWRRQTAADGDHVRCEGVDGVVAVGRPAAVAVTAQVDRMGPPALAEHTERRPPGVAGLAAAVQQHDGRRPRITLDVGRQGQPIGAREFDRAHPCDDIEPPSM